MKIIRRKTKVIAIGNLRIGGNHPLAIQSMTKTKTADVAKTVAQIQALEKSGCEIIRVAVKDNADAAALRTIKSRIKIPLVADIHFDWRLALLAISHGADKIRINPGNIGKREHIGEIIAVARERKIPIRIGVNSGSVNRRRGLRQRSLSSAMAESALQYVSIFEKMRFRDIVLSLKASGVAETIEAYRKISRLCEYPLHLGVTATGAPESGIVKSSIALGVLLSEGIGDTLRISLTDDPAHEVKVAQDILEALGLRRFRPEIISCPTCGRCEVDLVKAVRDLEKGLSAQEYTPGAPSKIAVMGCMVNGPGEACEADIGIAFGKKEGMFFVKGTAVKKIAFADCVKALLKRSGGSDGRHTKG
ncbi:MAG: flavodoxin-dependent (E)-4-hydroxy-3-methylbut-2-enyl-diphosphate synthase [Candidatus Omnitrophica bacterium]|nr:flavodoxin-dependent (E)-4-hydroxy-3-methylbut-2-enyl-diphosphate synthase [Candidatus Omnitrophota bacterium]